MSGNDERPTRRLGVRGRTLDDMFDDANRLVDALENIGLLDELRSLDNLATFAVMVGILGTHRYLRLVANAARHIINERAESIVRQR